MLTSSVSTTTTATTTNIGNNNVSVGMIAINGNSSRNSRTSNFTKVIAINGNSSRNSRTSSNKSKGSGIK